jgi:AcrR family transcriptional regulator
MVQIAIAPRPDGAGAPGATGASAETRRREILAAASRLFRERGFAATGMRDIAAALRMTAGNLYYYFENKQALLAYCQEATLDELTAGEPDDARAASTAAERLRRAIVAHVVALNESHPGSIAHLEIEALDAERRAPLLRKRKEYERRLERLIREAIVEGSFARRDPHLATLALLGALNWTVKWYREGGGKGAAQVGEEFADLFLRGFESRSRR